MLGTYSRSQPRTPSPRCGSPVPAEAPDNQLLRALPTRSSLLTAGVWAGWLLRAEASGTWLSPAIAAAVRLSATRVHCTRLGRRTGQCSGAIARPLWIPEHARNVAAASELLWLPWRLAWQLACNDQDFSLTMSHGKLPWELASTI